MLGFIPCSPLTDLTHYNTKNDIKKALGVSRFIGVDVATPEAEKNIFIALSMFSGYADSKVRSVFMELAKVATNRVNPTMTALEKIGKAFEGEAERLGLENDEDVVAMIKEIRKKNWEKNNAGNA